MEKLGDVGKSLNNSVAIMEGALGGIPSQELTTTKPKKQTKDKQPIIIYLDKNTKEPPKKKSINEQLFGER